MLSDGGGLTSHDVVFLMIRAQGPGGQNVNKVSCAVQLRFDIRASSLPPEVKERLLTLSDQRINKQGVIVIKAQSARSLEQNKAGLGAFAGLGERGGPGAHDPARHQAHLGLETASPARQVGAGRCEGRARQGARRRLRRARRWPLPAAPISPVHAGIMTQTTEHGV